MDPQLLTPFLDDPDRPAGTLRYHELQGFLFTVASAPELVPPSEWLPVIFGEADVYRLRVLGQWFDGIRFYAAASSPRRSRRTWAGLR